MDRVKASKVSLTWLGLAAAIVIIFGSFSSLGGLAEAQQTTANSPPTGKPTITKTVVLVASLSPGYPDDTIERAITRMVQVGDILTVHTWAIADADGLENATFSYQWVRSDPNTDTDIEGTTARTYTLVDDDEGKAIKVRVTFTDDAGNAESLTSYAVEVQTDPLSWLSVSDGTLTPAFDIDTTVYTVPDVPNATSTITLLAVPKAGYQVVVVTNPTGWGVVKVCGFGCYSDCVFGYGGTDSTVLSDAEPFTPGFQVDLNEGENRFGVHLHTGRSRGDDLGLVYLLTVTRAASETLNSLATGAPTVTGTVQVGETLTADTSAIADADSLENATFSYQWLSSRDTEIAGGTGSTYTLVDDDEGKVIKVRVSFTDDAGNNESLTSAATATVAARPNTPATGAPTVSGTSQVGQSLTVDTSGIGDSDGLTNVSYSYQWVRNDGTSDADIQNATGASYTLVEADRGKTIKVKVAFTDDAGNNESLTSAATATVAARPNTPATGAPTISGTSQVGETLTVDTSGISDSDGLADATFAYQWLSSRDIEIAGATSATHGLAETDQGKAITVRVSFTDDAGNPEALTSAATEAVAAAAPLLTAEFRGAPASHDGQSAFTFELRFSEEFPVSYVTLRDHAFTVTGGSVTKARRLEPPDNIRWEITVTPDTEAVVTVELPATTDCAADGAVCTEDGRPLSTRRELSVSGPH